MRRSVVKQVWIRPVDESSLSETKQLLVLKESLRFSYVCSRAKNPRLLSSCVLGLSWEDAERVRRQLLAAKRDKEIVKTTQGKSATQEALWKVKTSEHEATLEALRKEVETLTDALSKAEKQRDLAQTNVETLSRNLSDPSIRQMVQCEKPNRVSGGIAKLVETGGHGRPLRGGLPGLGKRR